MRFIQTFSDSLPLFFCSFHLLFLSLIRNFDLRFAPVEVLGQAKRNKFRGPFARENQIKASFHLLFRSLIRNFARENINIRQVNEYFGTERTGDSSQK